MTRKKMNNIYRLIIVAASVVFTVACSIEEKIDMEPSGDVVVAPVSPDVISGELLVRFDEKVISILEQAGVATKSGTDALSRSGILTVDEVLDIVDGYQIERVFPKDARSEDITRKEGLHQWYLIRFSKDIPVDEVARKFSRLGEVSGVTYNRTLKRTDAKPVPLSAIASAVSEETSNGEFNDPFLKYQWHLVNKGSDQKLPLKKEEVPYIPKAGVFLNGADVNVAPAWDKCKGHPSIIVAVMDEGVDVTHPDLKASMWVNTAETWRSKEDNDNNGYAGDYHGYNFVDDHGVISTGGRYDTGHGSHVAGVIAAVNNNGTGISSIAGPYANGGKEIDPETGVRIMSCQIFSGSRGGSLLSEIRAIKYAADNGAVVLQCSWGYISGSANPTDWMPQFSTDDEWISSNKLEKMAFDYFVHHAGSPDGTVEGGIVVFAAGNESAPSSSYPAAYKDYISVAAIAPDYTPAIYTNYGPGTDIAAPGGDQDYYYEYGSGLEAGQVGCVLSTLPHTVTTAGTELYGYGYMEGTSMACPHVSGVVALGLSHAARLKKHFKADEIKDMLYRSANDSYENFYWPMMSSYPNKIYYKYVASQQNVHKTSLDVNRYKGKMGHGLVDAAAFLNEIEGGGVQMHFPNVFISIGDTKIYDPAMYLGEGESYVIEVADDSVAAAEIKDGKVYVYGLKEGQIKASIKSGTELHEFIITVRQNGGGNGWL